jgi:hypothetical protein
MWISKGHVVATFAMLATIGLSGAGSAAKEFGQFTGTVNSSDSLDGSYDGVDGSSLIGSSISGNFSYDPTAFAFLIDDSTYTIYRGGPIAFNVDIGGHIFTLDGTDSDYVYLSNPGGFGGNNYYQPISDSSDFETFFTVGIEAPHLYTNSGDLGTVSFLNQTGGIFQLSENSVDGPQANWDFNLDSLSFNVPELSTWAMMLLGFVGLGFAGYRKAKSGRLDFSAT